MQGTRFHPTTSISRPRPQPVLRAACRGAGTFQSDWRRPLPGCVVLLANRRCVVTRGPRLAFAPARASDRRHDGRSCPTAVAVASCDQGRDRDPLAQHLQRVRDEQRCCRKRSAARRGQSVLLAAARATTASASSTRDRTEAAPRSHSAPPGATRRWPQRRFPRPAFPSLPAFARCRRIAGSSWLCRRSVSRRGRLGHRCSCLSPCEPRCSGTQRR